MSQEHVTTPWVHRPLEIRHLISSRLVNTDARGLEPLADLAVLTQVSHTFALNDCRYPLTRAIATLAAQEAFVVAEAHQLLSKDPALQKVRQLLTDLQ